MWSFGIPQILKPSLPSRGLDTRKTGLLVPRGSAAGWLTGFTNKRELPLALRLSRML
jgi:hypothetical protein